MSKGTQLASGLTPDEERYAGLLAEGKTQADAYRTVWPSDTRSDEDTWTLASRRAVKVRHRVQEIVDRAAAKTEMSLERLTGMILEDRQDAKADKHHATAVQADKLLADMYGHRGTQASAQDLLGQIVGLLAGLDRAASARNITPGETIDGTAVDCTDDGDNG